MSKKVKNFITVFVAISVVFLFAGTASAGLDYALDVHGKNNCIFLDESVAARTNIPAGDYIVKVSGDAFYLDDFSHGKVFVRYASAEHVSKDYLEALTIGQSTILHLRDPNPSGGYGFYAFFADWSNLDDNSGTVTLEFYEIGDITCNGEQVTILGTEGPDEINGTEGADVIHGLGGNDIIRGMGGDDVICGGDGMDVIGAGSGNDIVLGEHGHDAIWGGYGNDILIGGDGNDTISGGNGNDILYGENGNDSLYGRSGVDELYGGEGTENNDSCYDDPGTFIMGCEQFNGENIPPAPVPKTGQTSCWNEYGSPKNCEGTGQDGELQKGVAWPVPRFTDNGDGTVTDNLTGLIWLKDADCLGNGTWTDALDASNSLADGECELRDGSVPGDWRLPNVRELYSLIDSSNSRPALPEGHPFNMRIESHGLSPKYWTSTSRNTALLAWVVNFSYGDIEGYEKRFASGERVYAWAVRGGN